MFRLTFLALLATPAPVFARTAQLLAFDHRASRAEAATTGLTNALGETVSTIESSILAEEFATLAPSEQPSEPATGLALSKIAVPTWMRGAHFRDTAAVQPAATGFQSTGPGCTWEPYRANPRLAAATELRRARFYPLMAAVACEAGVPTHLFDALVTQESRYNPAALSPKGAIGLAQLMPGTARSLGVSDPWNVVQNLRGGARYLRRQLDEFGRYDLALGAYNAGPGRIRQYGRVPPFRETLAYVSTILTDVHIAAIGSSRLVGGSARPVVPMRSATPTHSRSAALFAF